MKVYTHYYMPAVLLILAALAVWAAPAAAQGRLTIKPFIHTDWQYDSNYNRTETNEKGVHTYSVKPGIDLGFTTDKSLAAFNYWFQVFRYDDKDENLPGQRDAGDDDYTAHNAQLTLQTQATQRLLLRLDNWFIKTRDPANADANSNDVDRFKYSLNRFSPGMTYRFGEKFGLGLKYTNLYTDYSDDGPGEGEDSVENRGGLTGYYYFTPRTSFDLDYQFWEREYDKNSVDYTSNQLMLNVSHQFNRLTLKAGAGYHNREFDDPVPSGDIDQFVWQFSGTWNLPRTAVRMGLGSNLNDAGNGDTYFTSTRLDAMLVHQFTERIRGTLSGYYQNADYETSDREDDRWLVSLAGDYLITESLWVGLAGGLEQRDSNATGRDFDNQYLMIRAGFNYDLGSR